MNIKKIEDGFFQLTSIRTPWICLLFLGLLARLIVFPHEGSDYLFCLLPWTEFIKENGYFASLQYEFHNYAPTYIYFLVLFAKMGLNPLFSIKVLSVLFDYLLAYFVGKIIVLKYGNRNFILVALALIPLVPTVLMNSSYWGQCDSIYSALAMGGFYFLLKKDGWRAALFLGLSFVFKVQAIMILPVYFVMLLRGNIKWYQLLLVPLLFFISVLPAWSVGRPLYDLLTVYLMQANHFEKLTMNLPNLYIWISNDFYHQVAPVGFAFVAVLTLVSGLILRNKKYSFSLENWVRLALLGAVVVPFFLPAMHERYMYLGDVLAVTYFFIVRKNIGLPIGVIAVSFYSYFRVTRLQEFFPLTPVFFVFVLLVVWLTVDFVRSIRSEKAST